MSHFLRFHEIEAVIQLSRVFQKKTEQKRLLFRYIRLKCIIVISNYVYLVCKLLRNFIQQKPRFLLSQKFRKIVSIDSHNKAVSPKIISMYKSYKSYFKVISLHEKFCTISCNRNKNRTMTRILRKAGQKYPLLSYMHPNCIIFVSNNMYFPYKFLCNFIQY